jgi:hypothetical protein
MHLRDEWIYLQVTLLVAIPLLYLPAFRVCDRQPSRPRFYILLILLTSGVSLVQAAAVNAYVNGLDILSDETIMVWPFTTVAELFLALAFASLRRRPPPDPPAGVSPQRD